MSITQRNCEWGDFGEQQIDEQQIDEQPIDGRFGCSTVVAGCFGRFVVSLEVAGCFGRCCSGAGSGAGYGAGYGAGSGAYFDGCCCSEVNFDAVSISKNCNAAVSNSKLAYQHDKRSYLFARNA